MNIQNKLIFYKAIIDKNMIIYKAICCQTMIFYKARASNPLLPEGSGNDLRASSRRCI
jgi:hypothetical protein